MNPTTAALDIEYRKVIPARYVEKRDGSPMACMTCGTNLVMGQTFAASTNTGWHSYCALCSRSPQAQIAGLLSRIEVLVAPLGDAIPVEVTQVVDQATPLVEAVLGGNTNQFLNAKSLLLAVRTLVGAAKRKATPDPLIDALRAIAATGHGFAGSLVAWYEKHGSLTANQQGAAERLVAEQARKAQAPQAPAFQPVPVVAVGLYRDDNDGTIRRIYKTGRGRLGCRRYNGVQFVYEGTPGLRLVAAGLDAGTTRLLNAVEASAFGKGIGRCFNCLSIGRPGRLSDDRSLAVGYGPDCAEHNGWWYPTADEAGQILRGTMDLDLKLTMSLSQGTTLSAAPSDSEVAAVVEGLERGDTLAGAELDDADLYIEEDEELSEALDAAAGTTTNCPECGSTDLATDAGPLTVCRSCDWTSWPAPLVPGVDYEPAVCDNCGEDEHTPEALAECVESVVGEPRTEDNRDEPIVLHDDEGRPWAVATVTPEAAVVTPECAWCHKAPGTLSFVCADAEAFKVCPTCRPVLVAGNRCSFHS